MQKCAETKVSEMPQSYFTFARTLPPSSKISKSVMALLERFGWNKVLIIVGKRAEWIQIKDAIKVGVLFFIVASISFDWKFLIGRNLPAIKILLSPTSFNWTITSRCKWKLLTQSLGRPTNALEVSFLSSLQIEKLSIQNSNWFLGFAVYLFIGEHIALVDFVNALDSLRVLENGEYIVISIDDFGNVAESTAQQYTSRSKWDTLNNLPPGLQRV